jgi:2-oxoisovalerate dehydrogenase E1 component alpha subunit
MSSLRTVRSSPGNSTEETLSPELLLKLHGLMVKARVLEERLISMYKQGDGYFWIGGPGEEAFNVPLGLLIEKGQGPQYDYCHFHYRNSGTLLAMGAESIDAMRQMKNTATDPYSGGRNFVGHFSKREWNVVPVSSPIGVQYSMVAGTALAQKRAGGRGISIVTGGDAGTAEGDFATCLIWASRPANPLPVLIIVTNNKWGISTGYQGQHGDKRISDRGKAFGIESKTIDGNDPEIAYREIAQAMEYVRTERKPFLLEAMLSRLYGHSSASGANKTNDEADCLTGFEKRLEARKLITRAQMDEMRVSHTAELLIAHKKVKEEPQPDGATIHDHIFSEKDLVGGDSYGGDGFAGDGRSPKGGA